jgi:peptidoglycan-N-acetylglucosamine deacetylase
MDPAMKGWLIATVLMLKCAGLTLVLAMDLNLAGATVFMAGSFLLLWHHLYPRAQGLCDVVQDFIPAGREVWLTIDDGPDDSDTPQILDLLDQFDAKATFFMIGSKAAKRPDLVREVVARGHELGCHTFTHPLVDFWYAGRARVRRELDDSLQVLNRAGAKVRFFRPPAGIRNIFLRRCLIERNLTCIAWTIRSGDGTSKSLERVVGNVLFSVRPGAIILMHEGATVASAVRVEAIRRVLQGLQERGYACVVPKLA